MGSLKSPIISGKLRFLPWLLTLLFASALTTKANPTIDNTHFSFTDDQTTISPFRTPNVTIGSSRPSVAVVVTVDPAKASFTTLSGFTDNGGGNYSFTGDPAIATTNLRGMVFKAVENRITPGTSENDTLTIVATDSDGSTTDTGSVVSVLSINDLPTISGITLNRSITDKQNTNLYAGFSFADVDLFGTQSITITIVQDDAQKGTIDVGSSGFSGGPTTYTFTGTPAAATTAIHLLNFRPTENRKPVGTNETTSFTLSVIDASGGEALNSPLVTTVNSLSINDPPTLSGISGTPRFLQTGQTNNPFIGALVGDVDVGDYTNQLRQHVTVQATFSGPSGDGRWIVPPGLGFASGSTYTLSFDTLTNAIRALQQVGYQAQTFPLAGTTNTINFTVVISDDHGLSVSNSSASDKIYTPYTPPGLSGTRSAQRMNDNATLSLFSSVGIQSFNGGSFSVIIRLDNDANGQLVNLAGFVKNAGTSPATYSFTGTSENATAAIRQILFQPALNRISGATTETTTFSIYLIDGGITNGPDVSTTVIVSPVNDFPIIQGISPQVTIADSDTRKPFPIVSITDVDESGLQSQIVTVSLDDTNKGSFLGSSLSGFVPNSLGQYTKSGSPSNVTAALHNLVFVPTPNRLPSGAAELTTFSIKSDDGQGGVVVNNNTKIRVAAFAGGPVFSLPALPHSVQFQTNVQPFDSVSVSDPLGLTLTLQLTNANWGSFPSNSIAAAGFTNAGPNTYRISGSASNVTAALQGLDFAPNTNLALGTVINFTLIGSDQSANTNTAYMSIVLRLNQRAHIVTSTFDYNPNDGAITPPQKAGTLRKAIEDASSNDHITFDLRSTVAGVADYPASIVLKTNLIVNKNLTIDAPGANLLTISGDSDGDGIGDQQLIEVNALVTINGLTLTKGHSSFSGGAIEVNPDGCLTLSYCAVSDSSADVWGGGIDVNGGCLSMDHCLVSSNSTSSSFGEGGGGVSLYTDLMCQFVNTTFAGNQQLAASGLGGGGLYAENLDVGGEFDVFVLNCTFHDNTDAAGHGSSIRPNVFDTLVWLQNTIVADGQGRNLENDQSGDIISLGGNLSDDGTRTIFSIGGFPYDTTIFQQPPDFTNTPPNVMPLADNHGPTFTHALANNSAAINTARATNDPSGPFLGTDQRAYFRTDGSPDIGAYERNATKRVIIQEILFAKTNDQFITIYVPHDSTPLSLSNFVIQVHGTNWHTFPPGTNSDLVPGQAIVIYSPLAIHTNGTPTGVHVQIASNTNGVLLDPHSDIITLLNPSNQVVVQVIYVDTYVTTGTNIPPGLLNNTNQSIVLSPPFPGVYLPYLVVTTHLGGDTNRTSNPGYSPDGTPLAPGNSPPRAYLDVTATDAQTPLPVIPVLSNDKDDDISDAIRVVGVGVTNTSVAGVSFLTSTSHWGAAVAINALGASVSYNPTNSVFLTSLPQGSNVVDYFQYTILDSSNGVDHVRGTTAGEISNNIVRATATVGVTVTGVNLPPTPQDDGTNTNPSLTISEDGLLDFTTANTILSNDTDPNTDDNSSTLTIISVEPTRAYQNSLQCVSTLGAFVTLDIRFNRNETHIMYDPRASATLNKLAVGQTATDTFYYSVRDRYGAIGTAAVNITVIGANDVVQANGDSLATYEDTPITVPWATLLGNDIDPDTGITNPIPPHLVISGVGGGTAQTTISALGARVQIVGTNVIYDPTFSTNVLNALSRKEVVVDTFTYTATDDYNASSNAVASVTITGRNDTPIAVPDAYSTGEKVPLTKNASEGVLVNDKDPDVNGNTPDDSILVIAFTKPSVMGATASMNANGSFNYDPRGVFDWLIQGQITNDTFSYTIMDHSLTIANDDGFSVKGNSSANILPVLANDALLSQVGGALSVVGVSTPTKSGSVSIDSTNRNLIYSPAANFVGVETFFYTNADGFGGLDFGKVTITVTVDPQNGNLVANNDWFTIAKGTTNTLDVLANDGIQPSPGSALSIVNVGIPDHGGSVSINGGGANNVLTYSPSSANVFPLTETFTYVVSGGGIARATGTVSVLLIDRTGTLTANDDSFTVIANNANNPLNVLANDQILPGPNSNLTITTFNAAGVVGTVSLNSNRTGLLYRPPPGVTNHQEPVITYTIADGAGGTGGATVSIGVRSSGFFADDDVFSVTKNSQNNSFDVLLNDAILPNAGQTLTITDIGLGTNSPQHGTATINGAANRLIYTPANGFTGDDVFTYEISYGTVERAQGHVRVKVVDTYTLPSRPDVYNVAKNSVNDVLLVLSNDYNLPRTLLSLTIVGLQTNGVRGKVSINGAGANNTLLYTPASGFIGRETFAYESSDDQGSKGTNLVTVNVGNLLAQDDLFSVLSDSVGNLLDVRTNDAFLPDTTTVRPISGLGATDHAGTVTTNADGSMVVYAPAPGFIGVEHFTYQMKNDSGGVTTGNVSVEVIRAGSDRATNIVTVTIIGTNDPPTITGVASTNITDKQTARPFANVTIADVDARGLQILTVAVSLDNAIKGILTNLGGFVQAPPGTYTMTGLGSNITTAIRGLVFVPTPNRITVPTTETTRFTITAYDGYITVTNNGTTVNVTAVNDPPLIAGTLANQCVYDHLSIRPFAGVTITEIDDLTLQPLAITITLAQPTFGFFTALGGFVPGTNGTYTYTNATAAQATAALRDMLYVPTPGGRLPLGGMETNRITLAVNDGFAPPVVDTNTTVISVDSFVKRLIAGDGLKQDFFGYSVSASRDLVVVGTPNDPVGGVKSGSAYIYSRNLGGANAWNLLKKISSGDGNSFDQFGFGVSLSGDTIIVGCPNGNTNGTKTGAIYIFERNQGGPNNWGQTKKITPQDGSSGDGFGDAVSINVDTIVVGSHLNKPGAVRSGAAYIYARNQGGTGAWGLVKKLAPADAADADDFAFSVAINGDTAVIGAQSNQGSGNKSGAIYIYDRNNGGANNWGQTRKVNPADVVANGGFGHCVAISADLITAGAPYDVPTNGVKTGSGYAFSRNQGGTNQWGQVNKFIPADGVGSGQFGISTTVDGELMAFGSNLDIDHGLLTGAVYVYVRNYPGIPQWTLIEKLVPPVTDQSDQAGFAISLYQNTLAAGAHFDDSGNNRFGVTYIYRLKCDNAPFVPIPIPDQIATPGVPFTFTLPNRTFADPDVLDTLTLSMSFFPPPPAWLTFNPGTATFGGVPDNSPGTYPVVVRATDQDGASVTASFNIIIPGTGTTSVSAKKAWRTDYFSPEVLADASLEATVWGDLADPDGDGVSNLAEYLFGTNPLSADPGDRSPLRITPSGNPDTVLVSYRRRTDDWRITYTLQSSTYLAGWQNFDSALVVNQSNVPQGDGTEVMTQEVLISPSAPQYFNVRILFIVPE